MSGIPHTEANIGRSGRPCLECGQPHTLRRDAIRPRLLTWAADDGHFYKEMPFDTWLTQRITKLEAALREIAKEVPVDVEIEHYIEEAIKRRNIARDALTEDK